MSTSIVDRLLASEEPSIRWKVRVKVLGEDPESRAIRRLREEIRTSPRVRALLDGHAAAGLRAYAKWRGGHWVLQTLAELGYPPGDETLAEMCDEVLATWLHRNYFREFVPATASTPGQAVPLVNGRFRRCGSQQGGALLAVVKLGLYDERADQLAERLMHWQWPDGGWNCDRNPEAASSSVYETLLPMRGLAAYSLARGDATAQDAADRAAEVLLERRMIFHRSTGELIRSEWAKLHYPLYWHYDMLAGLKGLVEVGKLDDPRSEDALDLLQSKQLPDGGWAAEAKYYHGVGTGRNSVEHVDWGGVDKRRMNEWVTADALAVLTAAGRL